MDAINDAGYELKRAVQRNHSVRGATVLVVAHVGAIEIEVSVRLVADFAGGRDNWEIFQSNPAPVRTSL